MAEHEALLGDVNDPFSHASLSAGFRRGSATPPVNDDDALLQPSGLSPVPDDDDALLLGDGPADAGFARGTATPPPPSGSGVPVAEHRDPQVSTVMDPVTPTPERPRPLTFAGGMLPDDFLRLTIPVPVSQMPPQHARPMAAGGPPLMYGHIIIQVVEAKLAKNYGITRMDPFCRFQLGRFERHSGVCPNGAKEPQWHQQVPLEYEPQSGHMMHVEVLDMGTFSDKLVAWGEIDLSPVLAGAGQLDDWFPLSGKQGEGKEGVLHLRLLFQSTPVAYQTVIPQHLLMPQMQMQMPMAPPVAHPTPQRPAVHVKEQDVRQLREMFPSIGEETITSILVANEGNVENSINALLSM